MTEIASVSGQLTKKDLKRLTGITRTGGVGPTTVYYAGVTAPIISAGVSVFVSNQLGGADLFSDYWVTFLSSLLAAFAGISWYFIFMRWSYRHQLGRGAEAVSVTEVRVADDGLHVERKNVTTSIKWQAVEEVRLQKKSIVIIIDGADTVLIPNHWFGKDNERRDAFHKAMETYAQTES